MAAKRYKLAHIIAEFALFYGIFISWFRLTQI